MNLKIDFSDPIIQKDDVLEITTKTLDSRPHKILCNRPKVTV